MTKVRLKGARIEPSVSKGVAARVPNHVGVGFDCRRIRALLPGAQLCVSAQLWQALSAARSFQTARDLGIEVSPEGLHHRRGDRAARRRAAPHPSLAANGRVGSSSTAPGDRQEVVHVHRDEGVVEATSTPSSCVGLREGSTASVDRGARRLQAIEPRKMTSVLGQPMRFFEVREGNTAARQRECPVGPAWSGAPCACRRRSSATGTGRSHGRPKRQYASTAVVRIGKARSRSR